MAWKNLLLGEIDTFPQYIVLKAKGFSSACISQFLSYGYPLKVK